MNFCGTLPDESQGAHIKPAFHGTDTRNYEPLALGLGWFRVWDLGFGNRVQDFRQMSPRHVTWSKGRFNRVDGRLSGGDELSLIFRIIVNSPEPEAVTNSHTPHPMPVPKHQVHLLEGFAHPGLSERAPRLDMFFGAILT